MIKITYHGHACFTLENEAYKIVLDPFSGVNGYEDVNLEANEIFCSHEHFDHNYRDGVKLIPKGENPFTITEIQSFHDEVQGAKRGPNTIRIFESEGCRIAHLGDIGCELPEDQLDMLKDLDAAMIPVGGTFTITAEGAKALSDTLKPRIIIPMHFRKGTQGFDVLQDISEFTALYEGSNREVLNAGASILISHGTAGQQSEGTDKIVVMKPDK